MCLRYLCVKARKSGRKILKKTLKYRALVGFRLKHHPESFYRPSKAGNILSLAVPVSDVFTEAKPLAPGASFSFFFSWKKPFPTYHLRGEGTSNRWKSKLFVLQTMLERKVGRQTFTKGLLDFGHAQVWSISSHLIFV